MQADLLEYHKSINSEFDVLKNRSRQLIGGAHLPTDGEHKETVLRNILETRIPGSLQIMRGFICYPDGTSSTQMDILIIDRNKPTLDKRDGLVYVTPDAVKAIIEVKTTQTLTELRETLKTLSEQIEKVRRFQHNCLAGLFVFEENAKKHTSILNVIQQQALGQEGRVINWLVLGPKIFIRFWKKDTLLQNHHNPNDIVPEDSWYSYNLQDLGQAYFVSNVVWDTTSNNVHEMQPLWFPIPGGKEGHREAFSPLLGGKAQAF